jgi:N-acetylmuramoyl-L-alanine amidase
MRHINQIIMHYSETDCSIDFDISDIRQWHLDKGWSDVGYHYVIKLDGTIQTGRTIDKVGAHCYGQNRDSIGICYVGGIDSEGNKTDTRTPEQIDSLNLLIQSLRVVFDDCLMVFGHNDYSDKECPGYNCMLEHN